MSDSTTHLLAGDASAFRPGGAAAGGASGAGLVSHTTQLLGNTSDSLPLGAGSGKWQRQDWEQATRHDGAADEPQPPPSTGTRLGTPLMLQAAIAKPCWHVNGLSATSLLWGIHLCFLRGNTLNSPAYLRPSSSIPSWSAATLRLPSLIPYVASPIPCPTKPLRTRPGPLCTVRSPPLIPYIASPIP